MIKFILKAGYDIFIRDKVLECSSKTVVYYRQNLEAFMAWLENKLEKKREEIYLDDITINDLKDYTAYLKTRERVVAGCASAGSQEKNKKPITNVTIQTYQRALRSFFNYCYDENLMNYDIADRFRLQRAEKKEILPVTRDEMRLIDKQYKIATEGGCRNLCILHMMIDQGARRGEVLALRNKDIMYDKSLLLLRGKGNKERLLPLSRVLAKYLSNYQLRYSKNGKSDAEFADEYVFRSMRNGLLTDTAINQLFRHLREKTGIERLHPHLLRHTFATSYIMMGGDVASLRILMGHDSIMTTDSYLHLACKHELIGSDVYQLDSIFFRRLGGGSYERR